MSDAGNGRSNPTPHQVIRPASWPRPSGYSDGIAARGQLIFVAGQVGWDPETHTFPSDDFAEQTATALRNMLAVLAAGGAGPEHVVRMTWFITDVTEYALAREAIGQAYRKLFGRHYPAISLVEVVSLLEPHAKIEIEATAVLPD